MNKHIEQSGEAKRDEPHLVALLRDHDVSCPRCDYNLRGTSGSSCPECGHRIDIAALLNPRSKFSKAWAVMLVCYAAALPWSVLYVWQRLVIRQHFYYGPSYDMARPTTDFPEVNWGNPWFVASYGWWLSVPVIVVLLLVMRRRIESMARWLRVCIAVVCLVMVLLAYRRWAAWYTVFTDHWSEFWWLP